MYLISFPSEAMEVSETDLPAVAEAARAVIVEAQAAGVCIAAGGIDEGVATVMVAGDGTVTAGTYPSTRNFNGGITILELPNREAAVEWAAKIATACRCAQEVRELR